MNEAGDLVRRAKAGSREAFAELVRMHQRNVRVYLSRFVHAPDAIDDVAQEVFVTAYRSLAEHRDEAALLPWLLGIARHRALHFLRGEARRQRREGRGLAAALAGWRHERLEQDPPDQHAPETELRALRECLQELPRHGRRLVKDHYFKKQTAEAIAGRLGKKGNAVRMALLRIRSLLSECIRRKLSSPQ